MSKVTIVIPCYNDGLFLLEAIDSVKQCDPALYEVIIVNDGSRDATTLAILDNLTQAGYLVHHQPNQGLAHARNTGIHLAQTPYVLPLDCDNKIRPCYLTESIPILEQNPQVAVVYSDVHYFGEEDLIWSLPEFDLCHLLVRNYIDACAVLRKSIWQAVGGYDEQMPDRLGYEDWEFWLRVAKTGAQFHHLPLVGFDYRTRPDSMVQACKIPANHRRLVEYIVTKHEDLYRQHLGRVIADKEYLWFSQFVELQAKVKQLQTEICHLRQSIRELGIGHP
ncbi:MAG: glycosyltransferase family A protein [Pseudanabaenaceae cyanobacterium SKYGB_i_bin29]|nr:glycosyltransferase family 2 protein [Pseudanabaenaceae cyanobacterium SKYG29]MDW8420546.1 glycosyltransferase family A protein [Pseudanabaenaceae cyanobacterium SKYGB_i_bin29]